MYKTPHLPTNATGFRSIFFGSRISLQSGLVDGDELSSTLILASSEVPELFDEEVLQPETSRAAMKLMTRNRIFMEQY
jgi:hypothetical protein